MDWLLSALLLVLLPVVSGLGAVFFGSWYLRLELRRQKFELAVLEDRLLVEIKRRAGAARWAEQAGAVPDVEAAVKELRQLAVGEEDGKGFKQGKEGGVYRGTV